MKLDIKTLQQTKFSVEVQPTDTIQSVKEQIAKDKGHAVELQKLIYSGKILDNAKTVAEYDIKENEFVVLMVTRPTTNSSASTSKAAATPTTTSVDTASVTASSTTSAAVKPTTTAPAASAAASVSDAAFGMSSSLLSGPEYETAIQNMVEMGFERDAAVRAMRASFNNPDRAIEYLMNGIPETAGVAEGAAAATSPAGAAAQGPAELTPQAQQMLNSLRSDPQFQQMLTLIRQNPALLQPIFQQLAQSSPALAQLISTNPGILASLLTESGMPGSEIAAQSALGEAGEESEGDEESSATGAGGEYIQITEEEKNAIDRLCAMGFERARVVEAFLACDRNEQIAANYLFDHAGDEDY